MRTTGNLTLNIRGYLYDLDVPKVMGILNVTPDSFFSESRQETDFDIHNRIVRMIEQGVDIIDIGGCSTRPGYVPPSPEEEWERVESACRIVKNLAPEMPISIDTFRAAIALEAIEKFQADIINDVSGGKDPEMFKVVASKKAIYVLTHNPESPIQIDATAETITWLAKKVNELHSLGLNDIIIDPGFGFGKTIEENFRIFSELEAFSEMNLPLLVGISRKSMIYKTLGITPEESLTGTIALDAIALEKGAQILRVHDVKEAVETIRLFSLLKKNHL